MSFAVLKAVLAAHAVSKIDWVAAHAAHDGYYGELPNSEALAASVTRLPAWKTRIASSKSMRKALKRAAEKYVAAYYRDPTKVTLSTLARYAVHGSGAIWAICRALAELGVIAYTSKAAASRKRRRPAFGSTVVLLDPAVLELPGAAKALADGTLLRLPGFFEHHRSERLILDVGTSNVFQTPGVAALIYAWRGEELPPRVTFGIPFGGTMLGRMPTFDDDARKDRAVLENLLAMCRTAIATNARCGADSTAYTSAFILREAPRTVLTNVSLLIEHMVEEGDDATEMKAWAKSLREAPPAAVPSDADSESESEDEGAPAAPKVARASSVA